MKKMLTFCLAVLLALSLSACGESGGSLESKSQFTEGDYVIEFDEDLLGEEYKSAGNEIKSCEYNLSFKDGEYTADMNFGNSVSGVYSVSGDGVVRCSLKTASGEYSPVQNIEGEIVFKVVSESEIEIVSAPENYVIKLCELIDGQWVLTSEEKDLSFWPLASGIKFRLSK